MIKKIIKYLLKPVFYIAVLVGIFSVTAMMVRNIHHPIFAKVKKPVIFIADLPKELYREFVSGKETRTPLLPSSVLGTVINHEKMPQSIVYRNKGLLFKGGKIFEELPADIPMFHIDEQLEFFYSQDNFEIIKYQINKNSPKEIWRLNLPFIHHEKYIDERGFIYLPTYFPNNDGNGEMSDAAKKLYRVLSKDNSPPYDKTGDNFRDDGVVVISPEGKIIDREGLTELFSKNGVLEIIYAAGLETDPFHLNSIYPAKKDFGFVKAGDLLLSLRHQSMLLIYRPSTLEIIWYKVGPWSNQHSAKFNDEGKIYLFNNNVIDTHYKRRSENSFINGKNNILMHDIQNDVTEEINNCVTEKEFSTVTGGYVLIKDDYIFTEYHNTHVQVICNLKNYERIILVPEHNDSGRVISGTGTKIIGHF